MMKIKSFIVFIFSLGLVFLVYLLGAYPLTLPQQDPLLRLALRYQNNKERTCRPYTMQEMQSIPVHMRQGEKCEVAYYPYVLEVKIDGNVLLEAKLLTGGHQLDRPLVILQDLKLSQGEHQVAIFLRPEEPGLTMKSYNYENKLNLKAGQIQILKFDEVNSSLILTSS